MINVSSIIMSLNFLEHNEGEVENLVSFLLGEFDYTSVPGTRSDCFQVY